MKRRMVLLVWHDAVAAAGWKRRKRVRKRWRADRVVSLGWLIRRPTKKRPEWVIAGDTSGRECNRQLVVPRDWVTYSKVVKP